MPDLTIVDLPSFRADPKRHGARTETIIACDFTRKIVLIGGTSYAGEMKKSVFTYPQLRAAGEAGDADALLGQRRRRTATPRSSSASPAPARRRSPPTRNRTLDRRRRARLGQGRRVQFRGRLLRQGDQAVARGRARDLFDHRAFRHGDGERDARSRTADSRLRRRIARPRTPASPIRCISSPTRRRPAAPDTQEHRSC